MARRNWDSLSDSYRSRLERSGISRSDYQSGQSLRAARGHATTPEHPGQGISRPEFREYYRSEERAERHTQDLQRAVNAKIEDVFSEHHKYRGPAFSIDDDPPAGKEPVDEDTLWAILDMDDAEIEWFATHSPMGWILWYHAKK